MILAVTTLSTLLYSLIVFFLIIMLLVAMLLFARDKLIPKGDVTLRINDNDLVVTPGSTLLSTLTSNGVYLPSACGGGGTCGMCKCQVLEGGGSILPTETGFFTRKEQQDHWRLGCQVKVRQDIQIRLPESVLGIKKWECEVVSNRNVATFIKEFVVKLPDGEALEFEPGGYIQIDVPKYETSFRSFLIEEEYKNDWDKYKMWVLFLINISEPTRSISTS